MRRLLPLLVFVIVALSAGPAFADAWGGAAGWGASTTPASGTWGAPLPPSGVVASTPSTFPTTDGNVYAIAQIGNVLYVAGDFKNLIVNGTSIPATRIAAIDLTTGQPLPGFSASANAPVQAISVAPDGSALYVGGSFSSIDNGSRSHVAKIDPATGALVTSWIAGTTGAIDGNVYAMTVTADRVYLGGDFTAVNGTPQSHVAAVDTATGALVPGWSVGVDNGKYTSSPPIATDGRVQALALSQDGTHLYVGGYFAEIWHGSASTATQQAGAASVFAADGTVDPTFAPPFSANVGHIGNDPFQFVTAFGGQLIVAIGGRANILTSVNPTTGATIWRDLATGDFQTAVALGRWLYVGGHMHSWIQDAAGQHPVVDAARINPNYGAVDTTWNPGFVYTPAGGNATYYGVWCLVTNGSSLFAGGAFLSVGGGSHPHLAEFRPG